MNDILEAEASNNPIKKRGSAEASKRFEKAQLHVEMMLKSTDIFQYGVPALVLEGELSK